MRVAVTGTPGTGKTTATEHLDVDLDVLHLNSVIREEGFGRGRDEERDAVIADLAALEEWLAGREDVLFESHLAHHFPADRVVVLRAHPDVVVERLAGREDESPEGTPTVTDDEDATAPTRKARENAESEALDVILSEAVAEHGRESVYEVDTTDRSPSAVAAAVEGVVAGEREPSAGTVSFVDWL